MRNFILVACWIAFPIFIRIEIGEVSDFVALVLLVVWSGFWFGLVAPALEKRTGAK